MSKKPCDLTLAEAAIRLSQRELSPVQLLNSCLERIDTLEESIQAWALVDRQGALASAHVIEHELNSGHCRGPLHGIPVGLKDIFYTAGMRTEAGSLSWKGFVPSYDATVVARLKGAGAIILGKTHTAEFAGSDPPPTRNPWNTDHTPGGSSSGSGAAVAAHMCPAALGSQTGGSTLRPAAYNGVVGFKPEYGRISTYGVVPVSWTMDHIGILARTIEDAALVFQVIAGHDPLDPNCLREPVPDCMASLLTRQRPPCLGLLRDHFFDHADEEMIQHTDEVVDHLRRAGAEVQHVTLPTSMLTVDDTNRTIMSVERAAFHEEMFATRKAEYGPRMRKAIEDGLNIPATRYARAIQARRRQRADIETIAGHFDALITPGAHGAAPVGLTSTGDSVMQRPWSVTGLPALCLPTGLSRNGLPLGIQLVGAPFAEDSLFAVAQWCERVLDVHLEPPL